MFLVVVLQLMSITHRVLLSCYQTRATISERLLIALRRHINEDGFATDVLLPVSSYSILQSSSYETEMCFKFCA